MGSACYKKISDRPCLVVVVIDGWKVVAISHQHAKKIQGHCSLRKKKERKVFNFVNSTDCRLVGQVSFSIIISTCLYICTG